jgi:ATP-dependent DNA helicase RecQ
VINIIEILEKYWGHKSFRPLQENIIHSILLKKDTLALLPTGGGKSICFQVPAMAVDGICIVISPLIALIKDQVENLKQKGINAVSITSAMSKREIDITLDNCIYGNIKFLYLSPERLSNEVFIARVKQMKVSFIAVDEAHCISQWGYDFRPSYLKIAKIRELLINTPIIALTATATPEVVLDIQNKLLFKKPNVFQKSFERTNLSYIVQKEEDKLTRLIKIAGNIKGTGIVYVRNRKKTQEVAAFLTKHNISADFYHAGIDSQTRNKKQDDWIKNRSRIIVATNAFGMGIDKPDVRFVVHLDLPDTLEAYFQEAGRGGRDEKKAFAVVLYNNADIAELQRNTENAFPEIQEIKTVYHALGNYFKLAIGSGKEVVYTFDIADFSNTYKLNPLTVFNSLKILEKEEYLSLSEAFYQPSKVYITATKEALYEFQIKNYAYDAFIKLLLRSYSSLFEGYVKVSEFDLAKRSGLTKDKVISALSTLDKYNLISYIPQTELPQLLFLRERVDKENLYFSKENYYGRKKKTLEKMDAVIHYITSNHRCRSQLLLAYFGEENFNKCASCDVCIEEKKTGTTHADYELIKSQVKQILQNKAISLEELINNIKAEDENKIISTVQWLIDNNKVGGPDNALQWIEK